MTVALTTRGLRKNFGALCVTDAIDFDLPVGARHALIGPNGSGKSTFINLLAGVLRADAGSIALGGTDITRASTERRVKRGLVRTFQINTLFAELTPLESVTMAVCERAGIGGALFRQFKHCRSEVDEAAALLAQFGLSGDALRPTRELAYGRQRLLEIALALAARPTVLLLDEPAAGVPVSESRQILDAIDGLPDSVAVLLIEHDIDFVFRFARHVTVLSAGRIVCSGPPATIAADAEVRRIYLGEAAHV